MTDLQVSTAVMICKTAGLVDSPQWDQMQTYIQTGNSVTDPILQLDAWALHVLYGMDTPQEIELVSTPCVCKGHRTDSLNY